MTHDSMMDEGLSLAMIRDAHARIRERIHLTPLLTSASLDAASGLKLYFKCENLQKVGAFKARGATNAVFLLDETHASRGVVTHSSGNHAAALARAARLRGIPAFIVMPKNAPQAKQHSVRRYGAEVLLCEPTLAAREQAAREVTARTGATFIHPYDDLRVMAGQGTTALEMLAQEPALDVIVCPVGGGGHLSGVAVAAKGIRPQIRVFGAEPAGADDAARSFRAGRLEPLGNPQTVADGLRTSLGVRPFREILRWVDDILTVSEPGILSGTRTLWEILKLVIEPSGAVGYAALNEARPFAAGTRVGVILTGGNLDLDRLPWS